MSPPPGIYIKYRTRHGWWGYEFLPETLDMCAEFAYIRVPVPQRARWRVRLHLPIPMTLNRSMRARALLCLACLLSPLAKAGDIKAAPDAVPTPVASVAGLDGIRFSCRPPQIDKLESDMSAYLIELDIGPELVLRQADRAGGVLRYTLKTPATDVDTLGLHDRPALKIVDQMIKLPTADGGVRDVLTVSRKEILLALLQHGRLTEFKGDACDVAVLRDHVAIRQNTVAWAESLEWRWPDGEAAEWNLKYWKRGTPQPGFPLHEAINDVFTHQQQYAIGCYTATKLAMIQGVLDYYRRVKQDPVQLARIEQRLAADREPLVDIEPGVMWNFETDYDARELTRPGKLLKIEYGIAPNNFIPGDWVYFLNTDAVSYQKLGYEGSNAIYLGRNRFDDYYNDNEHSYTYQEKLDEVYQWRHGVFSRSRDFAKIHPLSESELTTLHKTPAQGGIVTDLRVFPYFYGAETLPPM
ncbi:hypothetical protein AAKU55_002375 [Oxalobacteraceae bacterium GrIS 1.11]